MNPKDYVLFRGTPDSPIHLMRVTAVKGDSIHGRLEKDPHIKPTPIELKEDQVVLNLGKRPVSGRVYGHDLSFLYRRTKEVGPYGSVHLFTDVTEETWDKFLEGAREVYKKLKSNRLDFLLSEDLVWQVVSRETSGKWAGWFQSAKLNKEGELKSPPRISITLDENTLMESSLASYAYVIAHELGHHLHFSYLKSHPKNDRQWMSVFTETVTPKPVHAEKVVELLEGFVSSRSSPSSFMGSLEDEDREAFRHILKEINRTSHLSPRELEALCQNEDTEAIIKRVWPRRTVLAKLSPMISEYSLKNYHELFAETFAFWLLGRKIPERLKELMEQSVSLCRMSK